MKPIEEFKDTVQAVESLKEWQCRLELDDWVIKVEICEPTDFILKNASGECEYAIHRKSAVIRILLSKYIGERIFKHCAEKILVHELLHCKFALIDSNEDGLEVVRHQILEDIAVSLICAKYNIDREWFNNIYYEDD